MLPQHPGIQGGGDVAGLQHFDIHAPVAGYGAVAGKAG